MGLAQLPRIYFRGFTYWSPSTMNNNDYQPTYDPATATLNAPWLERHGLACADDFDAYVTQPSIVATPNSTDDPNISSAVPPAEWNFHGDNSCGFVQPDEPRIEWPEKFGKPDGSLAVTGYTDSQGRFVNANDPWIGLPLRMNAGMHPAKLVDVDPVCPWSSQIFVDTLSLGAAATGINARTAGRAHSRWVFFGRNLNQSKDVIIAGIGGALFQLGLPAAGIRILDPESGPLARQLASALKRKGVQGLMVRFVEYLTIYFQGAAFSREHSPDSNWPIISRLYAEYAAELEKYERGERANPPPKPINRAYSRTVGWIAPWMEGELRSMPGGRALHWRTADPKADVKPLGPAVVEYASDPGNPALVQRVSIDLGSSIPELGSSGAKLDLGTMGIGFVPVGGDPDKPTIFAKVDYAGGYDQASYEARAGVIDITTFVRELSVKDLEQNQLVVAFQAPQGPQDGLLEAVTTAETDDRAVYVEQPDAPWTAPSQPYPIAIQVRHLGRKPPKGSLLGIAQYAPNPPGIGEGSWLVVSSDADSDSQTPYLELLAGAPVQDGAYVVVPVPYVDDGLPYSTVTIAVRGIRCGPPVLAFQPNPEKGKWPPASVILPAITQQFFANVRVLPYHNALAVEFENWLKTGPSVDLVTQRAFDQVFGTFFLMYPVMRFMRDPLQFQVWRGRVVSATDPAIFETAAYMPVTRSLSAGQRRILVLWNQYVDGLLPTPAAAPAPVRRA